MPNLIMPAAKANEKQQLSSAPDYIKNKRRIDVVASEEELLNADLSQYSQGDMILVATGKILN